MYRKRSWLTSSLIFSLIAGVFSTVLVFSVPAEDPFIPALPEIPPPRSDADEALYRSVLQSRPDLRINQPHTTEDRNVAEEPQATESLEKQSRPSTTAEHTKQKRIVQTEPGTIPEEDKPGSSKTSETPVASERNLQTKPGPGETEAATPEDSTPRVVDAIEPPAAEQPSTPESLAEKGPDGTDTEAIWRNARADAPQPTFLERENRQKDFRKEQEDIANQLGKDRAHQTGDRPSPTSVRNDSMVAALLQGIEPVTARNYRFTAPSYYKGIYLTNYTARTRSRYLPLLDQAKKHGINTLVVDVQPKVPDPSFMKEAKKQGFYLVSRVVVFPGGLKTYPAPRPPLERVMKSAEASAKAGFMEVQLDYIRFADRLHIKGLTLSKRYRTIASVLKEFEERLRPHGVRIGADIFGRIPFNRDDIIGQKMEVFSRYMDTLYPMLYPSHFYGDPFYQKNPYRTIYDGKTRAIKRAGETRIIAYIQGFQMKVGMSGLSFKDYMKKQIEASRDSGGSGFIVWNPHNRYGVFFQALKETN
jgi:hypothetical protein